MGRTFFIFLMIFVLFFYLFNKKYEKKHHGKSFLQESETDKVFRKVVIADDILRVSDDLSKITNYGLFL